MAENRSQTGDPGGPEPKTSLTSDPYWKEALETVEDCRQDSPSHADFAAQIAGTDISGSNLSQVDAVDPRQDLGKRD
jgi:hypothetical protein